jgi:hypothetical protein
LKILTAVVGSSILHHLDLETALPRIFALLNPGGVMSFAEPNMLNPQVLFQKNVPWLKKRMGDSPDETALVRWRMHARLLKTGFQKVEVTPFDRLHPATPVALMRTVQSLGDILEKIPVMREFASSLHIICCRPE